MDERNLRRLRTISILLLVVGVGAFIVTIVIYLSEAPPYAAMVATEEEMEAATAVDSVEMAELGGRIAKIEENIDMTLSPEITRFVMEHTGTMYGQLYDQHVRDIDDLEALIYWMSSITIAVILGAAGFIVTLVLRAPASIALPTPGAEAPPPSSGLSE
jgi:hypothetical protein